ncbi:hypothetical protein IQ260_11000 [Leptolyngbya cf. ectocarpi LEGE 11479]|uniref:Uncharacterized protein n=1 Tax=Leptolyngbya cf. ectocarpi LEGE 11479 TaxID=1828722 RepID=A0A928ZRX2_LEPEC|nr:hypothetical protein [Leptolyngbya ectocarpi]MBE9067183.1 hypothetical protein [Leptolyngbya cf. ectocarpi LEGE 11479]
MNSTQADVTPHVRQNIEPHRGGHYTAQQIAEAHNVSDSTIRNRWFEWIGKVAPSELLKDKEGYTELGRTLFEEFANIQVCESPKERLRQRDSWVEQARVRYSAEWESAGIFEGELVPEEVSQVLALRNTQTSNLQTSVAAQLANIEAMIDQANTAELNLSEADIQAAAARGQQRAIALYQAEMQAELQTTNLLRQRRMGGDSNG